MKSPLVLDMGFVPTPTVEKSSVISRFYLHTSPSNFAKSDVANNS